jgi:MFS family permease
MGAFMLGPKLGPMFAPITGAALVTRWSWRSTQWFMVIYGWTVFLIMVFFMPETATNLEENQQNERAKSTSPAMKVVNFLLKPTQTLPCCSIHPFSSRSITPALSANVLPHLRLHRRHLRLAAVLVELHHRRCSVLHHRRCSVYSRRPGTAVWCNRWRPLAGLYHETDGTERGTF